MSLLDIITQAIASQNSGPFHVPSTPEEAAWDPIFGWKSMQERGEDMRNWSTEPARRANSANGAWTNSESMGLANAINAAYELNPDKGLFGLMKSQQKPMEKLFEDTGKQAVDSASDAKTKFDVFDYLFNKEGYGNDSFINQLREQENAAFSKNAKDFPSYNKK